MMSLKNSVVHHKKRTMKRFKISSWFFFLIVFNFNCYLYCIPANMTVAYECIPIQAAHIDYFAGTLLDQSQAKFGQESYARNQTYVRNLLSTCNLIRSDTFVVPVLPDDCHVIDSICSDNQHYPQKDLVKKLAQSSLINDVHRYIPGDNRLGCMKENIIINPDHFKQVHDSKKRIQELNKASMQAMKARHQKENESLESNYKAARKKKASKKDKDDLEKQYKKDKAQIERKHKQEIEDGPYITALKKVQEQAAKNRHISEKAAQQKVIVETLQAMQKQQQQTIADASHPINSPSHREFTSTMQARAQAVEMSIAYPVPESKKFSINQQTAGFLQAHNIPTQQFQELNGLPIQHQLTQELLSVLDSVAQHALHYSDIPLQKNLIDHCANLSSLTQQVNHNNDLLVAEQGTNCCHGLYHFMSALADNVYNQYEQMSAAINYCTPVLQAVGYGAAQGIVTGVIAGEVIGAGMIAAPAVTSTIVSVAACATAVHVGMLCGQAMINASTFGNYLIQGEWDKVDACLHNAYKSICNLDNIQHASAAVAGFATSYVGLPSNKDIFNCTNLQPVIAQVHNPSGEINRSFWLMTAAEIQEQAVVSSEILKRPEFANYMLSSEKILGFNVFNVVPKSDSALAPMFKLADMHGLVGPADQATLGQIIAKKTLHDMAAVMRAITTSTVAGGTSQQNVVLDQSSLPPDIIVFKTAEELRAAAQMAHCGYTTNFTDVLQKTMLENIKNLSNLPSANLNAEITAERALEFAQLSSSIRQLKEHSKITNNFTQLQNLIPEDIQYLNRIQSLQTYRTQIKNFLDTQKPYFTFEGNVYFIEDISSFHIHAGDYFIKDNPDGAHSNFGGHQLDYFHPQVNKYGPAGTKDVTLYNPRSLNRSKPSTLYSEEWSEFYCDLKAIEVVTSKNTHKVLNKNGTAIIIKGKTLENLEILIHYNIKNKRISTHYSIY